MFLGGDSVGKVGVSLCLSKAVLYRNARPVSAGSTPMKSGCQPGLVEGGFVS